MPARAFLISLKCTASFEPLLFRIGNVHLLPRILHISTSDIWMRLLLPALQAIVAFCLKYLGPFLGTVLAIQYVLISHHFILSPCCLDLLYTNANAATAATAIVIRIIPIIVWPLCGSPNPMPAAM